MVKLENMLASCMVTVMLLLLMLFAACYQYSELNYKLLSIKRQNEGIETFEMCGRLLKSAEFGINGIYYQDKYYCVWVKDREEEEINATATHELCHHLVYEDDKHFCEG